MWRPASPAGVDGGFRGGSRSGIRSLGSLNFRRRSPYEVQVILHACTCRFGDPQRFPVRCSFPASRSRPLHRPAPSLPAGCSKSARAIAPALVLLVSNRSPVSARLGKGHVGLLLECALGAFPERWEKIEGGRMNTRLWKCPGPEDGSAQASRDTRDLSTEEPAAAAIPKPNHDAGARLCQHRTLAWNP